MKKFALVSLGLPPSQSGQSIVLYHLLKDILPERYCLITLKNFHLYRYITQGSTRLKGPYYFLHPDYQVIRQLTKAASILRAKFLLNFALSMRARQIKKILVKENVETVVACTGDLFDPPAAYRACKELNIPFILYAFDYYSRQWTAPFIRAFAEEKEREIMAGARAVIAPNECMAKEYSDRYRIRPVVLHNPFDLEEYLRNRGKGTAKAPEKSGTSIVYTGAVYDAHYTAFQNLIASIPKTGVPDLTLHIYTPQSVAHLVANGITGPVEVHGPRPNREMPGVQNRADILFLPLAFRSGYPEVIRTSAPGKIGEYLASGKPVLVHAPKDSFIVWLFTKYRCGEVVPVDDPEKLAQGILHLLQDKKYRDEIVQNASDLARKEFDMRAAEKKFLDLIDR